MLNHIKCDQLRGTALFICTFHHWCIFFPRTYVLQLHIWYCDTNGALGQSSGDTLASNKLKSKLKLCKKIASFHAFPVTNTEIYSSIHQRGKLLYLNPVLYPVLYPELCLPAVESAY